MSPGPVIATAGEDGVLLLTLSRPRVRNAIDPELAAGLGAGLARLEAEDELRVGVIAGAGGHFCAGMDLRAFGTASPAEVAAVLDPLVRFPPAKPVIAAIEGYALGGGLELALACDLIVAAEDARLGLPEVRLSLLPSGGGLPRLATRLPPATAMEMALAGSALSGARLHELGLVSRLTPPGRARAGALELAAEIAANGAAAVAAAQQLVRAAAGGGEEAALWTLQERLCAEVNSSAEARERVRGFLAR